MVNLPDDLEHLDLRNLKNEIARLDTDLRDFARDMESRLDARVGELKSLIERADETIGRLDERLSGEIPPLSTASPTALPSVETGTREERVCRLARSGLKTEVIAARLNLPVGEVELILSLEKG